MTKTESSAIPCIGRPIKRVTYVEDQQEHHGQHEPSAEPGEDLIDFVGDFSHFRIPRRF